MKKIAFITGANRGLGLETSRQLARDHTCTVLLGCRAEGKGREAESVLQSEGLDAHFVPLDVTDEDSVAAVARLVKTEYGLLDILVNNAGIMLEHDAQISGVPLDTWRETFEVNLFGAIAVTQGMLPLLDKSSAPRIVNLGAILGSLTEISKPQMKNWIRASYSASKSALHAYTVMMAQEKGAEKWKINAAHPGWAKTDMGGPQALVAPERAVKTILTLATLGEDGPSGGLFHMGKAMAW